MKQIHFSLVIGTLVCAGLYAATPANALSLKEAIAITVDSNPEIGQSIENREAIEFELKQARGLFKPSVDLDASVGVRRLDNPSRRSSGIEDDALYPAEIGATITQKLFDGFESRAEAERQASRVDGASFRVYERSEYIGLEVTRQYFEIILQERVVQAANANVARHQSILADIIEGVSGGKLTEADRSQGQERLAAAKARVVAAEQELAAAKITFNMLVAEPIGRMSMPPSLAPYMPATLDEAIGVARTNNPRIMIASADIDAAEALVKKARAARYPHLFLEGSARAGYDIDGANGDATDLGARVVMTWNLYDGGIASADEQEQIRRVSEERLKLHGAHREVEEAVRVSWDRRFKQRELAQTYAIQATYNRQVVSAYTEQFKVGQRSLLDVLGAQNTLFNITVLKETAEFAAAYADYRLMASTGQLLATMGVSPPPQSAAETRDALGVPPTLPPDAYRRVPPPEVTPFVVPDFTLPQ